MEFTSEQQQVARDLMTQAMARKVSPAVQERHAVDRVQSTLKISRADAEALVRTLQAQGATPPPPVVPHSPLNDLRRAEHPTTTPVAPTAPVAPVRKAKNKVQAKAPAKKKVRLGTKKR